MFSFNVQFITTKDLLAVSSWLLLKQDQMELERMIEPTGKAGRKERRPGASYIKLSREFISSRLRTDETQKVLTHKNIPINDRVRKHFPHNFPL